MKKLLFFIVLIFAIISCEVMKENDIYIDPDASFVIATSSGTNSMDLSEDLVIEITGEANKMVLFTGDSKKNYDSIGFDAENTGLVVQANDVIRYKYSGPGIYKLTLLATGVSADGSKITRDTSSQIITVEDLSGSTFMKSAWVKANQSKVQYISNKYLAEIDSINIVPQTEKTTTIITEYGKLQEDNNFYVTIYDEYRMNRSQDPNFINQYSISSDYVYSYYNYFIDETPLTGVPTVNNYFRDGEPYAFKPVKIEYYPETAPQLSIENDLYIMPIPEMSAMEFRDAEGALINEVITERYNAILGTRTPEFKYYLLDRLDKHHFYVAMTYDSSEFSLEDLKNVSIEFETRLPGENVLVSYKGIELKGDGTDGSIDFSSPDGAPVRLTLTYTDPVFVNLDDVKSHPNYPENIQATAILDIYPFPED